jgi:hypothetical protein
MEYATGEAKEPALRLTFDRRIKLERGLPRTVACSSTATSAMPSGSPTWRSRSFSTAAGKNTRHKLSEPFRQSVFGRLAGYEGVNDAERLARDPAMRAIAGRNGFDRAARSSSQMGRFETEWLATDANLGDADRSVRNQD